MKNALYFVVENAGYEGENDLPKAFASAESAWRYAERWYGEGEIEALHVQVARELNGERSYEY